MLYSNPLQEDGLSSLHIKKSIGQSTSEKISGKLVFLTFGNPCNLETEPKCLQEARCRKLNTGPQKAFCLNKVKTGWDLQFSLHKKRDFLGKFKVGGLSRKCLCMCLVKNGTFSKQKKNTLRKWPRFLDKFKKRHPCGTLDFTRILVLHRNTNNWREPLDKWPRNGPLISMQMQVCYWNFMAQWLFRTGILLLATTRSPSTLGSRKEVWPAVPSPHWYTSHCFSWRESNCSRDSFSGMDLSMSSYKHFHQASTSSCVSHQATRVRRTRTEVVPTLGHAFGHKKCYLKLQ